MLKEGDDAYVLGELSVTTEPNGEVVRHVRAATDGRRLLVSNLAEETLLRVERIQLWLGATASALALLVLAWAYVQRYHVANVPGVLR